MNFVLQVLGGLALLVAVGLGLLLILNRGAFSNVWFLGRTKAGQVGDFAKGIETAAQMRQAALDAGDELKGYDDANIEVLAFIKRLRRQVTGDKQTIGKLEGQVANKINSGAAETDPAVVEKLKRIRDLKKAVTENEGQIESQTKVYEDNVAKANAASAKIKAALQRADQLKVRLDLGAQAAKLNAMTSKYSPGNVNSKMAKIDELEQEAQKQLDTYDAQSQLARDRNVDGDDDEDDVNPETDPELGDLLSEIKAKKGVK